MCEIFNFLKKHKFLVVIILLITGSFIYSKLTSYLVINEVGQTIQNIELFNVKYEDLENYLKNKGYSIENQYNEINENYNIIAKNKDEKIEIVNYTPDIIQYTFYNSNSNVTPLISNLNWGDSLFETKQKIGINVLNTRFNSIYLKFATEIHIGSDWIVISANENVRYSYEIDFNESNQLYKITIAKYN